MLFRSNLMKERLKQNICGLDDYADLSEVRDISTYQQQHIGDALGYACRFWTKHLVEIPSSGCDSEEVHKAIDEFFTKHLLFWIEVLVVMGCLDVSVHALNDIRQWYTLVSCKQFICESLCLYLIRQAQCASG